MYLYCYLSHAGVLGYQGGTLDAVVEHVNLTVLGRNEVDIQIWASDAEKDSEQTIWDKIWAATEFNSVAIALWKINSNCECS